MACSSFEHWIKIPFLLNFTATGCVAKSTKFRKGDVVMKWFSFTNHPMRMCGFRGFCYATQWRPRPWKRSIPVLKTHWFNLSYLCLHLKGQIIRVKLSRDELSWDELSMVAICPCIGMSWWSGDELSSYGRVVRGWNFLELETAPF
jgi:hypothetical protein